MINKAWIFHPLNSRAVLLPIVLILSLTGKCTVTHSYVKDGYDQNEKQWLKHIALVTGEEGEGSPDKETQRLFLHMSGEYLGHHAEYLIPVIIIGSKDSTPASLCSRYPGLDGYIIHRFQRFIPSDDEVELKMHASMVDCRENSLIWEVIGGGTYDMADPGLSSMIRSYAGRVNKTAVHFTAPFYHFIRDLYDTLPDPQLMDSDIEEKIELDAEGPEEIGN